jgi:hypothetical protein
VDSNLNIKIDTINIAIDSTFMQYYRQTSYDKTNKKLYVYNSSLHRLDYLDFDTQTNTNGYIQLKKEGPNGVERPNDILVTNDNNISLITYNDIIKINSNGEIISKNGINSNSNKDIYNRHYLFPSQDSGFDYNSDDDLFYVLNTNMQVSSREEPKKFYKSSKLISRYSFTDDELTVLDIPYPKEFQEKDFGFNNLAFVCLNNNKIYYSFSPLLDVFSYDISKEKIKRHETSFEGLPYYKYDYKDRSEGNHGLNMDTFTFNSNFGSIMCNKDYVIRVYLSSTPEHKVNPSDKSQSPKESAIQIFDKDLNLLKNFKVNSNLGFAGNFSDDEYFYFQIDPLNENEIRFLKVQID